MPQLTLFESSETLLADDERGRISYTPHFVDPRAAAAWFAELRNAVAWTSQRRVMYEREVDVPRLMGQLHYTHAVPKTSAPVGERISLAFRVKPARQREKKARQRVSRRAFVVCRVFAGA